MSLTGKFFWWHVCAREGYNHRPCLMHDPVGSKRGINIQLKGAKNFDCDNETDFCWCPLFVFFLVYTYCPSCQGKSMDAINYVILFLRYCNSLANPLIYSGYTGNFALISSDACSDEMNILKKCKPRLLLRERKKEIKRTNSLTNNELLLSGKRGNTRVMHINDIQSLFWSWQSKNNKRTKQPTNWSHVDYHVLRSGVFEGRPSCYIKPVMISSRFLKEIQSILRGLMASYYY